MCALLLVIHLVARRKKEWWKQPCPNSRRVATKWGGSHNPETEAGLKEKHELGGHRHADRPHHYQDLAGQTCPKRRQLLTAETVFGGQINYLSRCFLKKYLPLQRTGICASIHSSTSFVHLTNQCYFGPKICAGNFLSRCPYRIFFSNRKSLS